MKKTDEFLPTESLQHSDKVQKLNEDDLVLGDKERMPATGAFKLISCEFFSCNHIGARIGKLQGRNERIKMGEGY